jgi:hypothetical protein
MTTYTFKPEFEEKLGTDLEAFIQNMKDQNRFTQQRINELNSLTKFDQFICDAFLWKDTPENQGEQYWQKISKR